MSVSGTERSVGSVLFNDCDSHRETVADEGIVTGQVRSSSLGQGSQEDEK
jgi:hypothetical protein